MKKIWNQAPLIRLFFPFLAGILLAIHCTRSDYQPVFLYLLIALLLLTCGMVSVGISYKWSSMAGVVFQSSLFISGYLVALNNTEITGDHHFSKQMRSSQIMAKAMISQPLTEKQKSYKSVLEIKALFTKGKWLPAEGHVLVYFRKEQNAALLEYGDELLVKFEPQLPDAPASEFDFDYRRYLALNNIFHRAYIAQNEWKALGTNSGNMIRRASYRMQHKLLVTLRKCGLRKDELSVAAALMLGYTDLLDEDILRAYSGTGSLHVLSVSGLHVAIIYMVFNWMLFFLRYFKKGYLLKACILLILLWLYAVVTGLSPSVLRAAAMFTLVITAKASNRHVSIYNTLAASAFVLLIIDPFLVMEVGFQLSYIAVIGIVSVEPLIAAWIDADNRILAGIWKISAVSIAAQLVTFPLGLYYFHQFPNYFLLSNLIVIPLSTWIMYMGIAVFAFSEIPLLAKYLGLAFSKSIHFLNGSVEWMEKLPASVLDGIMISFPELCLVYSGLIMLGLFLTLKKRVWLLLAAISWLLVLSFQIMEQKEQQRQRKLIIHNLGKSVAIDAITGRRAWFFVDTNRIGKAQLVHKTRNEMSGRGINQYSITHLKSGSLCLIHGKRIFVFDAEINTLSKLPSLKADVLVISGRLNPEQGDLIDCIDAETVVLGGTTDPQTTEIIRQKCSAANRIFYSLKEQGNFVSDD